MLGELAKILRLSVVFCRMVGARRQDIAKQQLQSRIAMKSAIFDLIACESENEMIAAGCKVA